MDIETTKATANETTKEAIGAIEDHLLPQSTVSKIIKKSLPQGSQTQKDARAALSRSCIVFVNYLTSAALDVLKKTGR